MAPIRTHHLTLLALSFALFVKVGLVVSHPLTVHDKSFQPINVLPGEIIYHYHIAKCGVSKILYN